MTSMNLSGLSISLFLPLSLLSISLSLSLNFVFSLLDVLLRSAPLLCRYPSSSSRESMLNLWENFQIYHKKEKLLYELVYKSYLNSHSS